MRAYILGMEARWRGQSAVEQAEALGFDTGIVWGIDGSVELTPDKLPDLYDDALARVIMGRPLSRGEVAVALGHQRMYERFLATGDDWALFLEDDATLLPGIVDVAGSLGCLGDAPALVVLRVHDVGHNLRWPTRRKGRIARLIEPPFGSSCYFMNRRAAATAVAAYEQWRVDSIPDFPFRWKYRVEFWMSLSELSPHTYEGSALAKDRDLAVEHGRLHASSHPLRRLHRLQQLRVAGVPAGDLLTMSVVHPVLVKLMAGLRQLGVPNTYIRG